MCVLPCWSVVCFRIVSSLCFTRFTLLGFVSLCCVLLAYDAAAVECGCVDVCLDVNVHIKMYMLCYIHVFVKHLSVYMGVGQFIAQQSQLTSPC